MRSGLFKAEGAGNDFLLGTGPWADRLATDAALVHRLCTRRLGFGADGTLALVHAGGNTVRVVYRNADGNTAAFCGNGTRCAALAAVRLLGLPPRLIVRTAWADIPAEVMGETVRLQLPPPAADPRPLTLKTTERRWTGWLFEVGVPHLVVPLTGDLDSFAITRWGPALRSHPALGPGGANVMFVTGREEHRVDVRSWERGVEGETLSCASGAVAVALVWMMLHGGTQLSIGTRSGQLLHVQTLGTSPRSAIRLSGPAHLLGEVIPFDDMEDPGRTDRPG